MSLSSATRSDASRRARDVDVGFVEQQDAALGLVGQQPLDVGARGQVPVGLFGLQT